MVTYSLIAISVFLFTTTISGTIATVVIDQLVEAVDAYNHLERLGYIMVASTCIPYTLAIPCFYIAGKHYVEFKKCLAYCKSATLDKINLNDYKNMEVLERKSSMVKIRRTNRITDVEYIMRESFDKDIVDRISLSSSK